MDGEITTANAETNTDPFNPVRLINTETKKKPYDIRIKNNNPNEPKIQVNVKYSEKQKYRRYKTKTEPKLFNKIMINEEDDVVNTIKKAFGIEDKKNTNMSNVETSEIPSYPEINPIEVEQEKVDYINYQVRAEDEQLPAAPTTPPPPRRRANLQITAPTTPSISTEITAAIVAPKAMRPQELVEHLLNKSKPRSAPSSPSTTGAKETKLTEENEKKFQSHIKKNFVDLTEDEIKFLRANYNATGYLPEASVFGKTPKDRERVQQERDALSIAAFKVGKR